MRKNIYFNEETDNLLVDLSKSLNRNMSEVIKIALIELKNNIGSYIENKFKDADNALYNIVKEMQDIDEDKELMGIEKEMLKTLQNAYEVIGRFNNSKIKNK